jgi:protein SCO1/2
LGRLIVAGLLLAVGVYFCLPSAAPPVRYGPIPEFSLTERGGRTIASADLQGKVWIASFVFTRCPGPCPSVTATMARLQGEFADQPDVRLVTFTVDPERDDPEQLAAYAARFGADPTRWLFLTGKSDEMHELIVKGFKLAASGPGDGPGVHHSTRLAVVDRAGCLRGYFSGLPNYEMGETEEDFDRNLRQLKETVARLLRER